MTEQPHPEMLTQNCLKTTNLQKAMMQKLLTSKTRLFNSGQPLQQATNGGIE